MVDDFNNYSIENKLNATLYLKSYTLSDKIDSFGALIESLFIKKTNKYDLIYYDNAYTQKYGKYLLDLKKYLPKEHIEMYNEKIISESCIFEDKIVGLPYTVGYTFLYSNNILLNKYNKTIPKTWEELIDTGKFIKEKEKENNPDLVAYNGFFE
eukprot:jgi/Orpsp1_1/1192924/evm.model.d7180000096934.1